MMGLPDGHKKRIQEVGFLTWMNEQMGIHITRLKDDLASGKVKIKEIRFRAPKQKIGKRKEQPVEPAKANETPAKPPTTTKEPPATEGKKEPPGKEEKKERSFFDDLEKTLGIGEE